LIKNGDGTARSIDSGDEAKTGACGGNKGAWAVIDDASSGYGRGAWLWAESTAEEIANDARID
jgi:hypothetical protein